MQEAFKFLSEINASYTLSCTVFRICDVAATQKPHPMFNLMTFYLIQRKEEEGEEKNQQNQPTLISIIPRLLSCFRGPPHLLRRLRLCQGL